MLTSDQLKKFPLFDGLSADEYSRLLPYIHKRVYAKGVYLFYPQSPSTNTYLVQSGLVRLFLTNTHGEEFMLKLVRPYEAFGLPLLQKDQLRLMGAAAYQDSMILSIGCEYLIEAMRSIPQLTLNLYRETSTNARVLLLHTRSLMTSNLSARLAFVFLFLAHKQQNADEIEMPIHQAELASWVGASRGRLNRTLSEMQKSGLIQVEDNRILLIDRSALERIANPGDWRPAVTNSTDFL